MPTWRKARLNRHHDCRGLEGCRSLFRLCLDFGAAFLEWAAVSFENAAPNCFFGWRLESLPLRNRSFWRFRSREKFSRLRKSRFRVAKKIMAFFLSAALSSLERNSSRSPAPVLWPTSTTEEESKKLRWSVNPRSVRSPLQ
ncbi:hypothetical protein KSP40_PGU003876 [Platanthera guangdongensis]|uniref:Uncharacterized protein n=1 Tax=Platanthera guangdongensis TaxID=2320717 RepID=A0ABR2MYR9_9ASPA